MNYYAMEKAKYIPEEIDKMIDDEISQIDKANADGLSLYSKDGKRIFNCDMRSFIHWLWTLFRKQY